MEGPQGGKKADHPDHPCGPNGLMHRDSPMSAEQASQKTQLCVGLKWVLPKGPTDEASPKRNTPGNALPKSQQLGRFERK
ncbi:hypothetical protein N7530_006310 [Penicillium desertorum]|uniref:Uncharacterized protein n=1 Tax=Penicillium desertorum TaxID=1303715 RepID=A0A9W9WRH9_9EURO|nr:hypothetical protein N7530_006310 [Penicillium desertorum]